MKMRELRMRDIKKCFGVWLNFNLKEMIQESEEGRLKEFKLGSL